MKRQPKDANSEPIQVLRPTPDSTQVVTTGNQSTAFTTESVVRLMCTGSDGYIKFGEDPTADTGDTLMPENHVEYYKVQINDKISVSGATLRIDLME